MKQIFLFALMLVSSAATAQVQMSESLLQKIIADGQVTELDQVPALLPKDFRANFTIKHGLMLDEQGRQIDGPRGHLAEGDLPGLGQHSEPLSPRAFVFDPFTGFAISYTDRHMQGGDTLDTLSFDFKNKSFRLAKIDFPLPVAGQASLNSQNCTLCHGPNNRPIFSMYPDWPRFYGSDNDELLLGQRPRDLEATDAMSVLRREIQMREFKWFHLFKDSVAPTHPRYAPLFAMDAYAVHGFKESFNAYREYPFRSDVEEPNSPLKLSDVSRSFTRRSGLRFNLLYSRLLVQQVVKRISEHQRFQKFGGFFTYNLMRCAPEAKDNKAVMQAWSKDVRNALSDVEAAKEIEYQRWTPIEPDESKRLVTVGHFQLKGGELSLRENNSLLDYGQNLALFGLKINDVDMRFTYHHPAYASENAFRDLCEKGKSCADQVMHLGYLQNSYFNSYNDGSTTMDEHLTANLLQILAQSDKRLAKILKERGVYAVRGLLDKYGADIYAERMKFDRPLFTQLDSYSRWFSLPYPFFPGDGENPLSFKNLHHRAPYADSYRKSYNAVCDHLKQRLTARR